MSTPGPKLVDILILGPFVTWRNGSPLPPGKRTLATALFFTLLLSACSTFTQVSQPCTPFPRIELAPISEDEAVVEDQIEEGWALRFRDEETRIREVVDASLAAGLRGSEPWSTGCTTSDLTPVNTELRTKPSVSLSRATSPELMRRSYDRAAFWRENSDVWPSPDDLFWFEDIRDDARFRYECLSISADLCDWTAFYLEDVFLLRLFSFRGTEDEAVSYFSELAQQVSVQFNESVTSGE